MARRRSDQPIDPDSAELDVALPHAERRAVLTGSTRGPLTLAHGLVAGRPAELVADRARLELRRDGVASLALELRDWAEESRGDRAAPAPTTQAWRFWVVGQGLELTAETTKIRHARSPLAEATRYWRLTGGGRSWLWGDPGDQDGRGRWRRFSLWRDDDPKQTPTVAVAFVDVRRRNVEDLVTARGAVTSALPRATDLDRELAVLLAVGGFNRELVGRNTQLRRLRTFLVEQAIDNLLDDPTGEPDLDALELGP